MDTSGLGALSASMAGIQRGLRGIQETAEHIAHASVDRNAVDVVEPVVKSLEYQRALDASAALMRTSDRAVGQFVDELV